MYIHFDKVSNSLLKSSRIKFSATGTTVDDAADAANGIGDNFSTTIVNIRDDLNAVNTLQQEVKNLVSDWKPKLVLKKELITKWHPPSHFVEAQPSFVTSNTTEKKWSPSQRKEHYSDNYWKIFNDRSTLIIKGAKHRKKPWQCIICTRRFYRKVDLKMHAGVHTGESTWTCDQCSKVYKHKKSLDWHQMKHTGKKPFQCSLCNQGFTYQAKLKSHLHIHSGEPEKLLKCFLCPKSYPCRSVLNKHIKAHSTEKPYKCTMCSKAYAYTNSLTIHMRSHTGIKLSMCNICSKTFVQESLLKKHLGVHTRPHRCCWCNRTFPRKDKLAKHVRETHS